MHVQTYIQVVTTMCKYTCIWNKSHCTA